MRELIIDSFAGGGGASLGIEMATKPDCVHYDWGDTAPREYGAFCKVTCEPLHKDTCEECELYEKKKLKENE